MKKVVMIITVLLLSTTVFAGGTRVNAMGGIFSLIESTNYSVFPQRLLTGSELACIGDNGGEWGLVRLKLNNFLNLPVPIAWQIKAEYDEVWINDLYNLVNLGGWYTGMQNGGGFDGASQRINSIFAVGINKELIVGLSVKMYSNSVTHEEDYVELVTETELAFDYSLFGLETVWGGTYMLGGDDFVDVGIIFDTWGWEVSRTVLDDEVYDVNRSKSDGIMKYGINARYYKTGAKVDYAPYIGFDTYSFNTYEGIHDPLVDLEPLTAEEKNKYEGSVFNFKMGSGIHYKPAEGVKVYNELEFAYQSVTATIDIWSVGKEEYVETMMTLLPIYRCGVEIIKEIDPKTWWGFNKVQLWGGFNKTFTGEWNEYKYTPDGATFSPSDDNSLAVDEGINVTTGAALSNGNFKFEFAMDVSALAYDDAALNGVDFDLVYYFK
ncbi:MAG: hypothetical protein KAS62_06975 [Candidatus Delongbacteria bacterium]|nr:hypothetical protein [Candidatus Delongbacteria bacterium]